MAKMFYNASKKSEIMMRVKPINIFDRIYLLCRGYSGFFRSIMTKPFAKG